MPSSEFATVNRFEAMRELALDLARRLAAQPEVAGVLLLGGIAACGDRRFADDVSDIDLCVVLDLPAIPESVLALPFKDFSLAVQPWLPGWLPNFKFVVPRSVDPRGVPVDLHQLIVQRESRDDVEWDLEKLEAFAHTAEIISDARGAVRALLEKKLGRVNDVLRSTLLRILAGAPVRIGVDVDRCIVRGLVEHGHIVLTLAVLDVLKALFIANGRCPPNPKWLLTSIDPLPWKPPGARRRFEAALECRMHDEAQLRERRRTVSELLTDIAAYCRGLPEMPQDVYTLASTTVFPDRQLRRKTTADGLVQPDGADQYAKMDDEGWNSANWYLARD